MHFSLGRASELLKRRFPDVQQNIGCSNTAAVMCTTKELSTRLTYYREYIIGGSFDDFLLEVPSFPELQFTRFSTAAAVAGQSMDQF